MQGVGLWDWWQRWKGGGWPTGVPPTSRPDGPPQFHCPACKAPVGDEPSCPACGSPTGA